ncbi:ubiquitin-protein ligase-like protein E3 [Amylocarpus encephaloides]|uniref:HECT-type E3 ubiquitin transferase n=1 Tax=Amylocarpus encephaloides TaxID=45428 RepID=A0A9P7YFY9_9HELO|nr:ubiquitin-protein ligase-like protein E3 [Amylocarpus encephaloides]
MAPWSNRLLPPGTRNEPLVASVPSISPARGARAPSTITDADILESAMSIPTLSTLSHWARNGPPVSSRPTRASSHGRSVSHPFPSLFYGKKDPSAEGSGGIGLDSTDDDSGSSPVRPPNPHTNVKQGKIPERDLTTGKCMTCDSMVRWPKDLKVFRCTVCLTINDLEPILLEARLGDGHRAPVAVRPGSTHPRAPILSLEKTKRLIDQCVTAYLMERLKHDDGSTSSPSQSPPISPVWGSPGSTTELPLDNRQNGLSEITSKTSPLQISNHLPGSIGGIANKKSSARPRLDDSTYSSYSPGAFSTPKLDGGRAELAYRPKDQTGGKEILGVYQPPGRKKTIDAIHGKSTKGNNPFRPLEDYIITCFGSFECINISFGAGHPSMASRAATEGAKRWMPTSSLKTERQPETDGADGLLSELDAKTLLLGNFAENGSWWTGNSSDRKSPDRSQSGRHGLDGQHDKPDLVTVRSPHVDWATLNEWYTTVLSAGKSWRKKLDELQTSLVHSEDDSRLASELDLRAIEDQMLEAESHTQRVLLKTTESLLKRPGRPLKEPHNIRFLLILLANPLLYSSHAVSCTKERDRSRSKSRERIPISLIDIVEKPRAAGRSVSPGSRNMRKGSSGQHSGIIKRILGLLANLPNECHHHLVSWFARFPEAQFRRSVDLIGSFVTYRLTRQHGKQRTAKKDMSNDLIPTMSTTGRGGSAALHATLGYSSQTPKKKDGKPPAVVYDDDWQIRAAARVMALLFSANNNGHARRPQGNASHLALVQAGREKALAHGQILSTSDFYNTLLDYSNLIADFEAWEAKRAKFTFCQYPFFLSIWAKIQIMEHDARRQMEVKAREAFFDSIMTRQMVNQYLVLKVRRDCLVEDSLKSVSEVVGSGGEEVKKGLRIEFKGEEGIDAGGLRKEWFLLLVRDVFNPEHGMFTYDEDSQFCYFNPYSFETTDQFFLVGVVLGLAIYNSTILDVALPPFAFRKLLAAAPAAPPGATSHAKPSMIYSLEDLAEYHPALASGLRQLLDFEGDVETTFCRDFVADVDRYGQVSQIPLCPDGEKRAVTNSNRREFVDLYVRYLLDAAVIRQFEPFKRGFFTVCGGNALSLFRPEEIELLIRGSDEPLDIASLRAVSVYEHWGVPNAAETESVVQWFWQTFQNAAPKDQRKLLSFITGSDRIPAMGATNLTIKLSCLGGDSQRFPVARTCFNMISLWRYSSKLKLEKMLWRAVYESEGFGLK